MTRARRIRQFAALVGIALATPTGAQEQVPSEAALLNPLSRIDPTKLDGFLGRPLFSPTRRPPPAAVSTPPSPPASTEQPNDPPGVRLVGILRTPSESVAQVIDADGVQRLSLRIGDFLDGWTVASIDASTLTLKRGEREASLMIFHDGAGDVQPDPGSTDEAVPVPHRQPARKRAWSEVDRESFFGE